MISVINRKITIKREKKKNEMVADYYSDYYLGLR